MASGPRGWEPRRSLGTAGPAALCSCLGLLSHSCCLYFKGSLSVKCFGARLEGDSSSSAEDTLVPLRVPAGGGPASPAPSNKSLLPALGAGDAVQVPRPWSRCPSILWPFPW